MSDLRSKRKSAGRSCSCCGVAHLHVDRCLTRELPNNIPYAVKRSFIQQFQHNWELYAMACFDEVEGTFKRILMTIVKEHFGHRFKNLERAIR